MSNGFIIYAVDVIGNRTIWMDQNELIAVVGANMDVVELHVCLNGFLYVKTLGSSGAIFFRSEQPGQGAIIRTITSGGSRYTAFAPGTNDRMIVVRDPDAIYDFPYLGLIKLYDLSGIDTGLTGYDADLAVHFNYGSIYYIDGTLETDLYRAALAGGSSALILTAANIDPNDPNLKFDGIATNPGGGAFLSTGDYFYRVGPDGAVEQLNIVPTITDLVITQLSNVDVARPKSITASPNGVIYFQSELIGGEFGIYRARDSAAP